MVCGAAPLSPSSRRCPAGPLLPLRPGTTVPTVRVLRYNPHVAFRKPAVTDDFLNKLLEGLRACGLEPERETWAKVFATHPYLQSYRPETLARRAAALRRVFIVDKTRFQKLLLGTPRLLRRDPVQIAKNHAAMAARLGMSCMALTRKVVIHKRLADMRVERVNELIGALVSALDLDETTTLLVLKRLPSLICYNPATLIRNGKGGADVLGIAVADYARILPRMPNLLGLPASTLRERVQAFADLLGVPFEAAAAAMRRNPPLFLVAIETIRRNIMGAADVLQLPAASLHPLYLRKPRLLNMPPTTVQRNIAELAALFEMETDEVVGLLIRHPALIGTSPKSMAWKFSVVRDIYRALGFPSDKASTFRTFPLAYTYAEERLQQRLLMAQHGRGPRSVANLLSLAQCKADVHLEGLEMFLTSMDAAA